MQNSPLELEEYLLKELQFSLADELKDRTDKAVNYDSLSIDVSQDVNMLEGESRKWRCEVTIKSKTEVGRNYPYQFLITYVGFFNVVEGFPAEHVEVMVRANAPALLYSAARELLLPLTGRGRYPAILLPSVTFIEPANIETPKKVVRKGVVIRAATARGSSKKTVKKATKKDKKS